jgi:hypothetical protein
MANEPIYDVASFDCKTKLCSAQTVVETRLLPMGGVSISKVLSYSADCYVAVTDVFTGEARVSGTVNFKVLLLDSEGKCRNIEKVAEFTDKIECDKLEGGKPDILCRILDTDITSVSEGEIKLASIVEMELFDNESTRIKYLSGGGEDVFIQEERLDYLTLRAKVHESFSLSDEIAASGERILMAEAVIVNKNVSSGNDFVRLDGEIISNIITESEGNLMSFRVVTPYSGEIAATGATFESYLDAVVKLKSSKATLLVGELESAINLEFDVDATVNVYNESSATAVLDAFSVKNELALTTTELPLYKNRNQITLTEKVEGSVTLDIDMPIADRILCSVANKLSIANSYIDDGRLTLEGTVTSTVIYFSGETSSTSSVDVELPFSITTNENIRGQIIAAYGEVVELGAKLRRGNEIDIRAEIAVIISSMETEMVRMVTNLIVGDVSEIPAAAISLHVARAGESLWDIAKSLRTTPELILLQNPELDLPIKGGERVIVYRHLAK